MAKEKYTAYVGTYTNGTDEGRGIHIYDLDQKKGTITERSTVDINNASYLTISNNGKYIYSIADEGVQGFQILPDGGLKMLNMMTTRGMRGCYLSTDKEDKYLFVAGYHDGKVTVLRLNEDGSIGEITDEVYHKGVGSISERSFRPHVNCVRLTPDQKYLCAVDLGVDHVKIYSFNHQNGKLQLVDFLRCELDCGPRHIVFSEDGRFAYVISELKNVIYVYSYSDTGKTPEFELLQKISTLPDNKSDTTSASCALKISMDGNYILSSADGKNCVGVFAIDKETGLLTCCCNLPISGDYPKDIALFPNGEYLISLNHESGDITLFTFGDEMRYFYRHTKPLKVATPNCIVIAKI